MKIQNWRRTAANLPFSSFVVEAFLRSLCRKPLQRSNWKEPITNLDKVIKIPDRTREILRHHTEEIWMVRWCFSIWVIASWTRAACETTDFIALLINVTIAMQFRHRMTILNLRVFCSRLLVLFEKNVAKHLMRLLLFHSLVVYIVPGVSTMEVHSLFDTKKSIVQPRSERKCFLRISPGSLYAVKIIH